MRLYRLYYNSTYTAILHTVMALHIVLVTLLEPADSCRGAVNKTTHLAAWLNLLFCTLYAIDAGIQAAFRGIPYVRYHTWYIVKLCVPRLRGGPPRVRPSSPAPQLGPFRHGLRLDHRSMWGKLPLVAPDPPPHHHRPPRQRSGTLRQHSSHDSQGPQRR